MSSVSARPHQRAIRETPSEILDLDGAGCGDDLATGDLVEDPACLEVAVSGADVTDVTFEFIIVTP